MYVCTTDVCPLIIIHIAYPCFTKKDVANFIKKKTVILVVWRILVFKTSSIFC